MTPPGFGQRKGGMPRHAARFIPKLTAKAFRSRGFDESEIVTRWPDIVGAHLAGQTVPEHIRKDGSLVVRVASGFALELQHHEPQVLDRLASYFGFRAIKRLVLKQGRVAQHRSQRAKAASDTKPNTQGAETDAPKLDDALSAIPDERLRQSLTDLGKAIRNRRR